MISHLIRFVIICDATQLGAEGQNYASIDLDPFTNFRFMRRPLQASLGTINREALRYYVKRVLELDAEQIRLLKDFKLNE